MGRAPPPGLAKDRQPAPAEEVSWPDLASVLLRRMLGRKDIDDRESYFRKALDEPKPKPLDEARKQGRKREKAKSQEQPQPRIEQSMNASADENSPERAAALAGWKKLPGSCSGSTPATSDRGSVPHPLIPSPRRFNLSARMRSIRRSRPRLNPLLRSHVNISVKKR